MTEARVKVHGSKMIRSIAATGADGEVYVVIANLGTEESEISVSGGNFMNVTDSSMCPEILGAGSVLVLKEKRIS